MRHLNAMIAIFIELNGDGKHHQHTETLRVNAALFMYGYKTVLYAATPRRSIFQSLFLYNIQFCKINRRELTLFREQATTRLDYLPLRDLADLEPVLLSQLPVEYLKVLLQPLLVVALDDARHSLLMRPSQCHLIRQDKTTLNIVGESRE